MVARASSNRATWTSPRRWILILLLAALLIGVYSRFANLADNPGWDADEGYNWSIAAHLARGEGQMFALRYAFVQHPPVFYVLGAAVMHIWMPDLLALRLVSALCGVLTGLVLWGLGAVTISRRAGMVAAALYLIWPQAVLQSRWAYTYNVLALLLPLALWLGIWTLAGDTGRVQAGRAAMAGLCTGLALATDQEAIALLPALIYLLWPAGLRVLAAWLATAALPPVIYVIWMLVSRRADFLFDLQHTATRLDYNPSTLLQRLIHLGQFDPLIGLGLIGILMLPAGRSRGAVWLVTALLTAIVLAVRDPSPLFRAAEPILPLAALGLGAIVERTLAIFARRGVRGAAVRSVGSSALPTYSGPARVLIAAAIAVGVVMAGRDVQGARNGFATQLAPVLPRSTAGARQMARWVNAHTHATDLVIAMPTIAWLFTARAAEILQAVAIDGEGTAFYPAGIARTRFRYDTHLAAARFVVVDDYTRWAISQLPRERVLIDGVMDTWRVAYRGGEYVVYANPSIGKKG